MIHKLPSVIFIFLSVLLLANPDASAQDTPMDFDQPDCTGAEHHLFSELNAGKVVILEFVMLNCAPCISATKSLSKMKSIYEDGFPGRVQLYSMGFLNAYTCAQMNAWRDNNSFTHQVFTGGEQQVAYYGGMGMPTIVILGNSGEGTDHKVFFKSSGYTPDLDAQIRAAIEEALTYSALGVQETTGTAGFTACPSVSASGYTFKVNLSGKSVITLFNINGYAVASIPVNGMESISYPADDLPAGLYIARLKTAAGYSKGIKLIRQ